MKTLLLDRDGVLVEERDYDYTPENVRLLPGVLEGLSMLKGEYEFYVVSNQSGVARGNYSVGDVEAVHARLRGMLAEGGVPVQDIAYCPHHPDDECECRKPKTGMWLQLAKKYSLDAQTTVMAGNRNSDMVFARNIGCMAALVTPEKTIDPLPDLIVSNLTELGAFLKRAKSLSCPVLDLHGVTQIATAARSDGKKVVTTNGTFDLLHDGHKFLLNEARKQGQILIVGINSDASVRRYKGPDRPIESQDIRARKVAPFADAVFVFHDDDPRPWLPVVRPDVHVNAESYGKDCIEAPVLTEIGAKLVLIPVKKELGSTTEKLRSEKA